jgi:hypothetical protein
MSVRSSSVALAAGAVLAIGAPVAQAHIADDTIVSASKTKATSSHTTSAKALKALDQRWAAIAASYRLQQQTKFLSLRP